jgi:hypothetical protein
VAKFVAVVDVDPDSTPTNNLLVAVSTVIGTPPM